MIYLAVAPKSNAGYKAYNQMKALVKTEGTRPIPMHLRNAPTKMMQDMDWGKGYRYAHDEPEAFAAGEDYFPRHGQPAFLPARATRAGDQDC